MDNSLQEKIKYIESLTKPNHSIKDRELHFYEALVFFGISLKGMKKIIVAGTNGKGSTCNYLSSIIVSKNYHVGLFTSPYYITFNERIKIDNNPISDSELNWLLTELIDYETTHNHPFSFFEIITLASLLYFSRKKVDYIIMEVGIGGLYDCTNFINYDLGIITSISPDHTAILGKTRRKILLNKLGIFKPHTHLITFSSSFNRLIQKRAKLISSSYKLLHKGDIKNIKNNSFSYLKKTYPLRFASVPQAQNLVLAVESSSYFGLDCRSLTDAVSKTDLTGRTEVIDNLVFDGAHNKDAIKQLLIFLKQNYKREKPRIFYSVLKDKDLTTITKLLSRATHDLYFVTFDDGRSYITSELKLPSFIKIINISQIKNYINEKNILFVFTGSIHFVSQVRRKLLS